MALPLIPNIDKPFAPLSVAPAQLKAAQAGSQMVQEQAAQAQEVEHQLTEQQMGIAFGNLLRTGIEGAQAYVDDLEDGDVKQSAQNQLNSFKPALMNPKITPDMVQKTLLGFYQRVDKMNKAATIPGWEKQETIKQKNRIELAKEKNKGRTPRPQSTLEAKQETIPERKSELADLEVTEVLPEDYIPSVREARDVLDSAKNKFSGTKDLDRESYREANKLVLDAQDAYKQSIEDAKLETTYVDYLKAQKEWQKRVDTQKKNIRDIGGKTETPVQETTVVDPITSPQPSITGKGETSQSIVSSKNKAGKFIIKANKRIAASKDPKEIAKLESMIEAAKKAGAN